jgi:hypothetical protein
MITPKKMHKNANPKESLDWKPPIIIIIIQKTVQRKSTKNKK